MVVPVSMHPNVEEISMKYYCPDHPTELLYDDGADMFKVKAAFMPSTSPESKIVVCPLDQRTYFVSDCKKTL